jgi:hypothetical protein
MALSLGGNAAADGVAEVPSELGDRVIVFPDTANYKTLVVDLHTHSVFSDGHVWPKIRVEEALRDGLDALAVTEHLEWQPHWADLPHPDRNRSYQEALAAAEGSGLIVLNGSEITRNSPVGHLNAILLTDANELLHIHNPDAGDLDPSSYEEKANEYYEASHARPAQDVIDAANRQGAFVFWNHSWSVDEAPDGISRITEFHRDNAKAGKLHGIEVANWDTYSEEAFQIALDHDLALIGVSDVHDLIDWDFVPHEGGHRPVTLLLAEDHSLEGVREALFAKRTVVWFRNLLIGREEQIHELLEAGLTIVDAKYRPDITIADIVIANHTDARFQLRNLSQYTFMDSADRVEVAPNSTLTLAVKPGKRRRELQLRFEVENALVAPKTHPTITLKAMPLP